MDDRSKASSSDHLSTISKKQKNITSTKATSNQAGYHYFHVHCLSEKKTLKDKKYISIDDIKRDAFGLYKDGTLNDDNAILTYLDNNNVEVLLTTVPDLLEKGHSKDLFIRFVHPVCAMCSNPFGIVEGQLLLQCPEVKCNVQYCKSCVQAIQGSPAEHPFICIACKENVTPQHNPLIEKHIIWNSMCKLYGTQSLFDLKKDSNKMFCHSILKDIEFRVIHLQSRLNTFHNRVTQEISISSIDTQIIIDVNDLYINLKNLTKRIKETDQEMELRGIVISDCLEKYKKDMQHFDRLCDTLDNDVIKLRMVNDNITTDTNETHKENIKEVYRMNNLDRLSCEQNIKAIDAIWDDLIFRKKCLSLRLETGTSLLEDKPDETKLLKNDLKRATKRLETISVVEEEIVLIRGNLRAIERYINEYDKLLRDDKFQDIPCSKFILLLEMMRTRTEELEMSNNFPQTVQLMKNWQNDHGIDNEFKPKVIDLFKTVELDVTHLLSDQNCIYSLSYKVGVIGDGSVGKSALIMNLASVYEFSSMIAVERSTFNYLEFDTFIYKHPRNNKIIPITFVDIEGATDTDKSQSTGNYIELINKANCDLYIIVFDRLFNDHNRTCQDYIENELHRKCLLVRSKADLLFSQCFSQMTGKKYEKTHSKNYHVNNVLSQIKNHASKTLDDKCLDKKVYLTAAACEDDLKGTPFAIFDLDAMKKKLVHLAVTDFRTERICKLAILASITVINTCFRRGYTVSLTKYRWLAAGASIVPFLDELPAFFGREKIRQSFGIHDKFAVTNAVRRTKDSFEEYLTEKKFTVPEDYLKSGYFEYLRSTETKQASTYSTAQLHTHVQQKPIDTIKNKSRISQNAQTWMGHAAQTVGKPLAAVLCAVGTLSDGAARLIVPTTKVASRAVSTAGIVVGAVLTPVFAAWSFYSTGNRMNEELHLICDALVVILPYFVAAVRNDCFQCIQSDVLPPSDEDSLSSDDD